MGLLTLAVSLPALKPPSCGPNVKEENRGLKASTFQQAFFFALYVIALGNGGQRQLGNGLRDSNYWTRIRYLVLVTSVEGSGSSTGGPNPESTGDFRLEVPC
ncbi:hypothetical protein CRG98_012769 [Punica granatum]|uniref:Uncharacterized protein n=1 Tax=Punica granatum TaxID=22663 RepID=A0A2I0KF17_PUNGR|nr:hypothetical protein CRG98_012769 [Punica granatum]